VRLFGLYPCRCRTCEHRFLRRKWTIMAAGENDPSEAEVEAPARRRPNWAPRLTVYAIMLLLLAVFLYFISRPPG